MNRSPTTPDARALAWAGFKGHRFIVTADGAFGVRRVRIETDDPDTDLGGAAGSPRLFERTPRGWRRIK